MGAAPCQSRRPSNNSPVSACNSVMWRVCPASSCQRRYGWSHGQDHATATIRWIDTTNEQRSCSRTWTTHETPHRLCCWSTFPACSLSGSQPSARRRWSAATCIARSNSATLHYTCSVDQAAQRLNGGAYSAATTHRDVVCVSEPYKQRHGHARWGPHGRSRLRRSDARGCHVRRGVSDTHGTRAQRPPAMGA